MRKVLITGAGTGIGLACTQKFLKNGWTVIAHFNRSSGHLEKLKSYKSRLMTYQADFRQSSDVLRFLDFVKQQTLMGLVNNAALYDFSTQEKNRIQAIKDVLAVNAMVPALIAEVVFKKMCAKREGHIVNISSIAAKYGSSRDHIFYGISKRGLEALTRTLAREGAAFNICVNTIRPGVVSTDFHKKIKKNMSERKSLIPMKRFAQPSEVADLVYYLCHGNKFMTNQILTIAGGE